VVYILLSPLVPLDGRGATEANERYAMIARSGTAVRDMFAEVPRTYELVNHLFTGGLDIVWRRRAASIASAAGGTAWLDVCTGTGEMAADLGERAGRDTLVVGVDFSMPMMRAGARRPRSESVLFACAAAESLPFSDGQFDLVTISFATRNIAASRESLLRALREFHRVLAPGGRLVNLETSQPRSRIARTLFHWYARSVVRAVGEMISGSRAAYSYLSGSLLRFYGTSELAALMREAGFPRVRYRPMTGGIVAVHEAMKEPLEAPRIAEASGVGVR
jgi:demethylmenaquinone methyltransferase/2-methoxy-6-polyprenyl-1,4-benzoquinol methylase